MRNRHNIDTTTILKGKKDLLYPENSISDNNPPNTIPSTGYPITAQADMPPM